MRLPSALNIPHHPCTASWEIKSLILLISFSKITQSQDTSANYSNLKNLSDKGKITHFFLQKTSLLVWVRTIWHDNECLNVWYPVGGSIWEVSERLTLCEEGSLGERYVSLGVGFEVQKPMLFFLAFLLFDSCLWIN